MKMKGGGKKAYRRPKRCCTRRLLGLFFVPSLSPSVVVVSSCGGGCGSCGCRCRCRCVDRGLNLAVKILKNLATGRLTGSVFLSLMRLRTSTEKSSKDTARSFGFYDVDSSQLVVGLLRLPRSATSNRELKLFFLSEHKVQECTISFGAEHDELNDGGCECTPSPLMRLNIECRGGAASSFLSTSSCSLLDSYLGFSSLFSLLCSS